ncbi:MAG: TolC family protein [Candidatus Binatia bacterium]
MTYTFSFVCSVTVLCTAVTAHAFTTASSENEENFHSVSENLLSQETISLDTILAYVAIHNPAIQTAQSRLRAAQQIPAQVSAYDDPRVMWDNWNTPENLRIDQAGNNIFRLSQKIPFPGKLSLQGQIAAKEAEQREAELRATESDVSAQVKKAYYDLWLTYQNVQVYRRDTELVAKFAHIAERKYAVGQVSQPDVLRAQVELTRLANRVTTETLALQKVRARLNALLSRPPEAPLGIPQDPPSAVVTYSMADLEPLTLKNRPELIAQTKAIEKEQITLALARKAYYPDFEFSVSRFVNFRQHDGFGFVVSATIPLAFRYKYDARVEEAVANQQAAQSELRRVQDLALFEVKQTLVAAQTALEQLKLFLHTHIPQAEQALASSQIGYQTGKVDFLSLIDSLRVVEQVHLEHLMATANFEKAWAELERAVGQPLPRTYP